MATDIIVTGIMNTTRTKKQFVRIPISALWVGMVTVLLLVFGVPSLVFRLSTLSGDAPRLALLQGQVLSDQALSELGDNRESVASWHPSASLYGDLAAIALAKWAQGGMKDRAFLQEADYWQRGALARVPSDPYGWFRLAFITETMEGDGERTAQAWRQSVASAPYEPRLIIPRLEMALRLERVLGAEAQSIYARLIGQAWEENPWHLARSARDYAYLSLVEGTLRDRPDDLARLQKILKEQL